MPNIQRFIKAQQGKDSYPSYQKAYKEIEAGRKQSHWIWYVFPQLATLGYSSTAKYFGIADFNEACEYLQNEELCKNYQAITLLVLHQLENIPVDTLMGGATDAQKLASSITLFREVASFLLSQGNMTHDFTGLVNCCDQIMAKISNQGYFPCEQTLVSVKSAISKNIKATDVKQPITPIVVKEQTFKEPKEPVQTPTHDFSDLSNALDSYIEKRKNEWSFHYNFLGVMSVLYWLQDAFTGTDHFNNKSRDIKISAATQLKRMIDNKDITLTFTHAEKTALEDGRLNKLIHPYGRVEDIMQKIADDQEIVNKAKTK